MTDELRVFKDADALDRWRIDDLNPRLLRTQAALCLLGVSQQLWSVTADLSGGTQAFEEIIGYAVRIGVLRAE